MKKNEFKYIIAEAYKELLKETNYVTSLDKVDQLKHKVEDEDVVKVMEMANIARLVRLVDGADTSKIVGKRSEELINLLNSKPEGVTVNDMMVALDLGRPQQVNNVLSKLIDAGIVERGEQVTKPVSRMSKPSKNNPSIPGEEEDGVGKSYSGEDFFIGKGFDMEKYLSRSKPKVDDEEEPKLKKPKVNPYKGVDTSIGDYQLTLGDKIEKLSNKARIANQHAKTGGDAKGSDARVKAMQDLSSMIDNIKLYIDGFKSQPKIYDALISKIDMNKKIIGNKAYKRITGKEVE